MIAEGIEDAATAKLLKSLGCQEGQGYYFGAPMSVGDFEKQYLQHVRAMPEPTAA